MDEESAVKKNAHENRKVLMRLCWIQIGLSIAAGIASFFLSRHWDILSHQSPGNGATYFVQQDLASGTMFALGLLTFFCVGFATYRKHPRETLMATGFAILWSGPKVFKCVVILLNTSHPYDPTLFVSKWTTFDQYMDDPWLRYGLFASIVLGGFLMIYARKAKIMPFDA